MDDKQAEQFSRTLWQNIGAFDARLNGIDDRLDRLEQKMDWLLQRKEVNGAWRSQVTVAGGSSVITGGLVIAVLKLLEMLG